MILIALGANLPSEKHGPPRETLAAALLAIEEAGITVTAFSRWYATAPVPASDQPDFVNIVASLDTQLEPGPLMTVLHGIEHAFGRARGEPNAARVLDVDLLDHNGTISTDWPVLPHPRMEGRAFVLVPLRDVAPDWRHPVSGRSVSELVRDAPDLAGIRALMEADGA